MNVETGKRLAAELAKTQIELGAVYGMGVDLGSREVMNELADAAKAVRNARLLVDELMALAGAVA